MESLIQKRRNFIIDFVYFGIIVGLYYFTIKYAFGYILPFLVAAALAVILQKPIRKIGEKLHIKAHGAISTIFVLLIVVIVIGAISGAISLIVNELKDFFSYLFGQYNSIGEFILTLENDIMALVAKLPDGIEPAVRDFVESLFLKLTAKSETVIVDGTATQTLGPNLDVVLKPLLGAWGVVKGIPSMLLSVVVTIISCVFMTAEYGEIRSMILGLCSKEKAHKLIHAKKTVVQGVGKLFKAYATIMLITFTEMFLGLSLMKLIGAYEGGYIAIISFVTCIVDIVPVLGTGTVLLPWALYSIIVGQYGFGIGLIILYVVITVLRQAIEPRLVAHQVGLPAIITIMAMFIGAKLFGAIGIVLLPLTVIVIKLMYDDGIIGRKFINNPNAEKPFEDSKDNSQEVGNAK